MNMNHFFIHSKVRATAQTWLRSVQHEPADGDVAVSQAVQQFGDVVQDDLLSQEALLQQLLDLLPEALHAGGVAGSLWEKKESTLAFRK